MHTTGVDFSKLSEPKRTMRIYERALRTRSRGQDELRDDTVLITNLVIKPRYEVLRSQNLTSICLTFTVIFL
jgi:hypothetical protein